MKKTFPARAGLILSALMVLMVGLTPRTAFAYIDPGTGSFVIQGVIAAVVGAGVALKLFWHRVAALFGGKAKPGDDEADD